jgi:hypothetical protein
MVTGFAQALHTAARRYCIDEAARRRQDYFGRSLGESGTETEDLLPRHLVLDAILAEVERLLPDELASEDEARDLLALAGEIAEDSMTRHWARRSARAAQAMREEREGFVAYVRRVSAADLAKIEPLPDASSWWYAVIGRMDGEPRTRHYLGVNLMPTATVLVIQPGDRGVLVLRYAADGTFGGDTWHFTLDDAMDRSFEYPGAALEWHEIPRDIADPTSYALERAAELS